MTGIQVVSAGDRPSRQEQIAQLCGLVEDDGVIKLRILPQLYDASNFQYAGLRDAQWTLTIPKATLQPDTVEAILAALGACLRAMGDMGPDQVLRQLNGPRIV
jgi:hypothetical protein